MESPGDKDGTAESGPRRLLIGVAGLWIAVGAEDAPRLLGDDPSGEARRALETLCQAGCDRLVVLYVLKVMRERLPCHWWNWNESMEETERRRDDAKVFDRAAAIIRERCAHFLPSESMSDEDKQNIPGWDHLAFLQGGVHPLRLLLAIEAFAERFRAPDEFRQAAALRANQDDFDVISRYVLCAYVRRATGAWHDHEVAVLLAQVGNYKSDRRKATLDAAGLLRWRANNRKRLEPLSEGAVDQLAQYSVKSPSSK